MITLRLNEETYIQDALSKLKDPDSQAQLVRSLKGQGDKELKELDEAFNSDQNSLFKPLDLIYLRDENGNTYDRLIMKPTSVYFVGKNLHFTDGTFVIAYNLYAKASYTIAKDYYTDNKVRALFD